MKVSFGIEPITGADEVRFKLEQPTGGSAYVEIVAVLDGQELSSVCIPADELIEIIRLLGLNATVVSSK